MPFLGLLTRDLCRNDCAKVKGTFENLTSTVCLGFYGSFWKEILTKVGERRTVLVYEDHETW